jgi:hypothetical protein
MRIAKIIRIARVHSDEVTEPVSADHNSVHARIIGIALRETGHSRATPVMRFFHSGNRRATAATCEHDALGTSRISLKQAHLTIAWP